jgi:hypothetical protein
VLGDEGLIMLFEALRPGDYDVVAGCSLCEQCPTLRFVDLMNNGMIQFGTTFEAYSEMNIETRNPNLPRTKVLGYRIDAFSEIEMGMGMAAGMANGNGFSQSEMLMGTAP